MKLLHKLAYVLFNSKQGFKDEADLLKFKIYTFAKTVGCAEQIAEFTMIRRRVRAKLRGETDWRKFYD
jgi:hypothetical protein